jgi:hypothetical protein
VIIMAGFIWNTIPHTEAWIEAKRRAGVADVRDLSTAEFRELLAQAEQIRKECEQSNS